MREEIKQELRRFIENDELNVVIDKLRSIKLSSTQAEDAKLQLISQYSSFIRKTTAGTLLQDQAQAERNQLSQRLLEFGSEWDAVF